jgi:hypothetical protein
MMQFLSAGKRSLREETHARDTGLQPGDGGLAIAYGFVERLHCQAHTLLVLKAQVACRPEDAAGVMASIFWVTSCSSARVGHVGRRCNLEAPGVRMRLLRPGHEQITPPRLTRRTARFPGQSRSLAGSRRSLLPTTSE